MNGMRRTRRSDEQGFSLVEVVIAIGVLASVLISISSMFIMGGRQVKTGKTMTEATALAHAIMETLDAQSFLALYTNLGAAGTDQTITVSSNVTGSPIVSWQTEISRKLANGVGSVRLDPFGGAAIPSTFGSCVAIKVTVTLAWNELGRAQTVQVSTMRF